SISSQFTIHNLELIIVLYHSYLLMGGIGMDIWFVSLIGLLVGILGTGLGSLIGILVKKTNKVLSFLLGVTGGFMLFIVSFHLFPEAFYLGGVFNVILGVIIGISI